MNSMLAASRVALIVDDDAFFRAALRSILMNEIGCSEVIEAACFDEAIERLDERDDISAALFELSMPGMKNASNLRVIRELFPSIRVAVVSASDSRRDVLMALEAGVHGYVPKSIGIVELSQALRAIFEGKVYVPPFLADISNEENPRVAFNAETRPTSMRASLTPRQEDVLNLVIEGKSNKEIARAMEGMSRSMLK